MIVNKKTVKHRVTMQIRLWFLTMVLIGTVIVSGCTFNSINTSSHQQTQSNPFENWRLSVGVGFPIKNVTVYGFDKNNDWYTTKNSNLDCIHGECVDHSIRLSMPNQIGVNSVLEYYVFVLNITGNSMSRMYINDEPVDYKIPDGYIGYWNKEGVFGNGVGKYHIIIEFYSDRVWITSIKPDGTNISEKIQPTSPPYSFGFESHGGHDGLFEINYANFTISEK